MSRLTTFAGPPNPPASLDSWLDAVRHARFATRGPRCPRCGSSKVHRWGRFSGRQRYRCRGRCQRTFSDLTGTPAAYIKKIDRWALCQRLLEDGVTLRQAALTLGVHLSTAFRWRHRLLDTLASRRQDPLEGTLELDLIRFPQSFKGAVSLPRPARRRKIDASGFWTEPHCDAVVMADHLGGVRTVVLSAWWGRRPSEDVVEDVHASGPFTDITEIRARGPGVRWDRVSVSLLPSARERSPWRVGIFVELPHAGAYRRRLTAWMRRFRGVASRYLERYLAWHRWLDRGMRASVGELAVRWPMKE